MPPQSPVYFDAADKLQADWTVVDQWGISTDQIHERSVVFERLYQQGAQECPAFLKIYTYKKHGLQRLWRAGRSRIETRNLIFFNEIGIPSAKVLQWGERRAPSGRIVEEFIITEAIQGAIPLDEFMQQHCPDRSTPEHSEMRDEIIDQVSKATRLIHQNNFLHKDLKWRNLLARIVNSKVEVHWIDCPIGDFSKLKFRHQRGIRKDCATLDKLARELCTKDERLRFLANYLQESTDSEAVVNLANSISQYRMKRFDAEDNLQRIGTNKLPIRIVDKDRFQSICEEGEVLEKDAFGLKVLRLPNDRILKIFRRKRLWSSQIWSPHAWRFNRNARILSLRGIQTISVKRYLQVPDLQREAVIYSALPGVTLRHWLQQNANTSTEAMVCKFARFVARLHQQGILFRSLHFGNVLLTDDGEFALIDIVDMHFRWRFPLGIFQRMRNLNHLARYSKDRTLLTKDTTETFINAYLQASALHPISAKLMRKKYQSLFIQS